MPGYSICAARMWPSPWCTPMKGMFRAKAMALAADTPTRRAPIRPGAWVTATSSMSSSETEAPASASRMTGMRFFKCSRDASSGTTPPYFSCTFTWEETTFDSTAVSRSTAAAVSSQEVSIPRVNIGVSYRRGRRGRGERPEGTGVIKGAEPNPDQPEKLLATEDTENTEGNKKRLNFSLAFLCALCELCGKYFFPCGEEFDL